VAGDAGWDDAHAATVRRLGRSVIGSTAGPFVSRVGAGLDLRGGATGEDQNVAAIGSVRGLCLEVDRAGPRGWERGATSSHVEAHIYPVGGVARWPATPCGGRKRGALWDPLRSDRTNRNRSSVAATALQMPLGGYLGKEVREWDEHDADAGLPSP
jgi:hypothetical protein